MERKGALDSLCYSPGYAGREAITVNEISTVRGASCSAPGQSRVPWTSPSQLPACEREGLQVSAPGKQLLTKAAAVVIPGAQGPSQPHSQSEAVFYVVVALVRVRGPESFLNGFQRTSERSQATCYMAGITA